MYDPGLVGRPALRLDEVGGGSSAAAAIAHGPPVTRAVDRALRLLACLDGERRRATLTELARAAGLPSSTAARLLDTLEQARFVRRASDGAYTYGTKLLQLGVAAVHQLPLYEVAIPHLERLVQQTGETANLAIADGDGSALYLNSIPSPRAIRHASWIGRTVPLEGTAVGAALLGRAGLGGYAVVHAAVEPDVSAMAAAILGPLGVDSRRAQRHRAQLPDRR